jgi:hypothetical protein
LSYFQTLFLYCQTAPFYIDNFAAVSKAIHPFYAQMPAVAIFANQVPGDIVINQLQGPDAPETDFAFTVIIALTVKFDRLASNNCCFYDI